MVSWKASEEIISRRREWLLVTNAADRLAEVESGTMLMKNFAAEERRP